MKKITILLSVALAFSAYAQNTQRPEVPKPQIDIQSKIQLMKQFDKDGDGRLNAEERKLAMEAIKNKSVNLNELRQKHVDDIMQKFDKDGDSKLDKAELATFLEEQRKILEKRRMGPGRNFRVPKEVLAEFDKDGDGKPDNIQGGISKPENSGTVQDTVMTADEGLDVKDEDSDNDWGAVEPLPSEPSEDEAMTLNDVVADLRDMLASFNVDLTFEVTLDAEGNLISMKLDQSFAFVAGEDEMPVENVTLEIKQDDNAKVTLPNELNAASGNKIDYSYDQNGNLVINGLPANGEFEFNVEGNLSVDLTQHLTRDEAMSQKMGYEVCVLAREYWTDYEQVGDGKTLYI